MTLPLSSRRQFLRQLGISTGTTAAALSLSPLSQLSATGNPGTHQRRRVIIVGAGMSGLCAAYELEQRGYDVVMLEASDSHTGGRVRTHQCGNGLYGELGAMRIPAGHTLTRHYIQQFTTPYLLRAILRKRSSVVCVRLSRVSSAALFMSAMYI